MLEQFVRKNIKEMTAYSSARHEYAGQADIFLDANESAFDAALPGMAIAYNRYPDPLQEAVKAKLAAIKGVEPRHIFLGNGSDEAIDLLFRIFCEPGKDNVLLCPPTYGMYQVCAAMNDIAVKEVPLTKEFQLDLDGIEKAIDPFTKMIFLCSPNNPTGNSLDRADIEVVLNNFDGLVVIDEAYINYSRQRSFIPELEEYPNLVILQTLSKAWGLAGLRLGMAFAGEFVIGYLNKVKYPYNISTATQELVLHALANIDTVNERIKTTVQQRAWLAAQLLTLSITKIVYPSDANFLLVQMSGARDVYEYLCGQGIIVRDRSKVIRCDECLRITIGTPEENQQLMNVLKQYSA